MALIGHTILKEMENGKYSTDNYIIHCNLSDKTLILLSDKRLLAVKKSLMSNNWETDWSEEWTNVSKVDTSGDGLKIRITTKVRVSGTESHSQWFASIIASIN